MSGIPANGRWVRGLVILTALLCLGTVGYAGQVWWAKQRAWKYWQYIADQHGRTDNSSIAYDFSKEAGQTWLLQEWRITPWSGEIYHHMGWDWKPRRFYYEFMVLLTGQSLPNDPTAWEAWFKAHPNLVWDEKRKRLVDSPDASP